ncbi:sterile alpha motif domain-containing protein 3-like [Astyanax mexicanus]|uniref:Sterile alpha motif domain-containing protein 3-like n=1 Tax=Astyanax mexicanus TaxID=7994 RepID=A0A8T2MAX9_ASTMX|nr:sterile alpha motif domain-containing protein 3-like [Astyanax mexicanus]XP_049333405.1 sterile alpha motif domain-containing protein 3-like [Astyanax mexicanus]XP_049333406.1 sterile alpha motif domain-containing protein 3-like [Astyanax mexicanus]XP_049333407.1 sterile alpha motif domain-containing protein 3-like [Astyanax mexicanus]XP_049337654.1 sterile alpha motif domain-containing protein 3-like [Astyanax mexicanus]XP_049337655.1 sterile alpha motif domain-containing protein 3-like [A
MLLRIIINKDDIRKIQTDSEPETLDSFYSFLKCKLGLGGDFVVQFQDPDFGNEFCNLSSLSELPKEKATLKVILKQIPESPQTDSTLDTASLSSPSSSSMEDTPSCRRPWPDPFVIPKFSYDVELKLKRGNEAYQENGTLLITNKDTKSEILEKLAEEIYKYSAYPSREQYDIVAQSLVKKHPCLREPGSVKGWYCWKFSLKFKMGNYRNKLRVSGCSELTVNRRNSGPKQKLKKAKKSEVNFLPDVPEGKTQNVLEEERAAIVAEMKKKKVDWKKVTDMMASTFPLRRKEIVEEQPLVAEVKAKWPALFTDTQIEAEFARLTSTDLWDTFVSGLDQYMERFLQMFKAKSHCIQALSSLLSLLDDDNSVQKKRAVILRGLPHFLREDPSKLLKIAETTESEEQMAKGVSIGVLLIQEEEDVIDFSVVLEEQIILNGITDFPHAVAMLVGLLFALNIDYPKELRYTFEVIQKVLMNIGGEQCSARVHGLRNRLLCKTL